MKKKIRVLLCSAIFATVSACVESTTEVTSEPAVDSSSDLTSFTGARAGQAEMGIQNLGYELIRTDGLTAYWFNQETGACAQITTADGRYSDVAMLPAGDC